MKSAGALPAPAPRSTSIGNYFLCSFAALSLKCAWKFDARLT